MQNKLSEKNILFFTRTMNYGGTENVILQLCQIFNPIVNKIVVCSSGGENTKKLSKLGIKHYVIPDIQNKNIKNLFNTASILKQIVEKEKIDIIHTHHRMAAFYVTAMKLYKKCAFFNTSHTIFHDKKFLTKWAFNNAYVIACGKSLYNNLLNFYGLPCEKTFLIENCVEKRRNLPDDNITFNNIDRNDIIITNIGRLVPSKDFETYIKTANLLVKRYNSIKFLIAGIGDEKKKLKKLVSEYKLKKNVIFLGYINNIESLLKISDFVVSTSLFEGLPLNLVEACMMKKAIIATNVDGNNDIIKNNFNGLLINKNDPIDLSKKIEYLIKNKSKAKRYANNAYKTYQERFTYERFKKQYINLYYKMAK